MYFEDSYKINNNQEYEIWKNTTLRFLYSYFKSDRCIENFESTLKELEKQHYKPNYFEELIGILESCKIYPRIEPEEAKAGVPLVSILNNNSQSQSQEQTSIIVFKIFTDAIKDEITGKQYKELEAIAKEHKKDPIKLKTSLIGKMKSFGEATFTNIVANILTNPEILNKLTF